MGENPDSYCLTHSSCTTSGAEKLGIGFKTVKAARAKSGNLIMAVSPASEARSQRHLSTFQDAPLIEVIQRKVDSCSLSDDSFSLGEGAWPGLWLRPQVVAALTSCRSALPAAHRGVAGSPD